MNIFTTIFCVDVELSEKIVNKAPWQTEKLILNKDHPFQGLFRRWSISLTKLFHHHELCVCVFLVPSLHKE